MLGQKNVERRSRNFEDLIKLVVEREQGTYNRWTLTAGTIEAWFSHAKIIRSSELLLVFLVPGLQANRESTQEIRCNSRKSKQGSC